MRQNRTPTPVEKEVILNAVFAPIDETPPRNGGTESPQVSSGEWMDAVEKALPAAENRIIRKGASELEQAYWVGVKDTCNMLKNWYGRQSETASIDGGERRRE